MNGPRRPISLTPEARETVLSRLGTGVDMLPDNLKDLTVGDGETALLVSSLGQAVPMWIARMLVFAGVDTDHEIFSGELHPDEFMERVIPLLLAGMEKLSGRGFLKGSDRPFTAESLAGQISAEHSALIVSLRGERVVN